jgi:hypothetical protein
MMRDLPEFLQLLADRRYAIIEAVQIGCLIGTLAIIGAMIADRGAQNGHNYNIANEVQ